MKNKLEKTDLEILRKDLIDISKPSDVMEYNISKVRGSVRLRSARFLTGNDISILKMRVQSLKFPKPKK